MPCARLLVPGLAFLQLTLAGVAGAEPSSDIDKVKTAAVESRFLLDEMPARRALVLGAYDPHNLLVDSDRSSVEHVFVYWQALDETMLAARMSLARSRGRTLMVTVEPYTKAANWRDGGDRLFSDIRSGRFDRQIEAVCGAIAAYPAASWIRWGHEMEQPTDRYPWARGDASGYIGAYRYFVDACRKIAPRARFVWSPKGEQQLADYYPGDDYVDLIGLSVWGLEKLDWTQYHKPRSFTDTFNDKYRRVERFGKPVIIAELGVAGTGSYRHAWMAEISALSSGSAPFPLLSGVVYFNDREPYHWPDGYGSPDWRMTALELSQQAVLPDRFQPP